MKYRAFEKLCVIAAKESWCADIRCTTCGHQEFRRAWPLLARGYEPGTREWERGLELLGTPPLDAPDSTLVLDQDALGRVLSDARLEVIGRKCKGAAWLKYVGLGLFATERAEVGTKRLTQAWLPQLLRMVESREARRLEELGRDPVGILRWADLERIEPALQPQYRAAMGEDKQAIIRRRLEALERERRRLEEELQAANEEH